MDLEARFGAWRLGNPLKVWREKNAISMATVAAATGCSANMVVKWENGSSTPSDDPMTSIAVLMGITTEQLSKEWDDWLAAARSIR